MDKFIVKGGNKLDGEVTLHGAKNSVLPILAATIIAKGKNVIHNCPDLSDVSVACEILEYLGAKVTKENDTLTVDTTVIDKCDIPEEMMREMRSSIIFLAPVSARMKKACLCTPGGCDIGSRPIDLHLYGLKMLGMKLQTVDNCISCSCDNKIYANNIVLPFPSVGATENIMIAATTAIGTTTIVNPAKEPEIQDLADFLNSCGAKIYGVGSKTITIEGVKELSSCEHTVIPDRILAATLMCCGAVTNSEIVINNIINSHITPIISAFCDAGCKIYLDKNSLKLSSKKRLRCFDTIKTMPYPDFPTDCQAPLMAVATVSKGLSVFEENIFENRFKHIDELRKMGAKIKVSDKTAFVQGVKELHGEKVTATDLRGGAALVIASLRANGITEIDDVKHIDRGYEKMEKMLGSLGADIKRV